ncbi:MULTISPECIES: hypothetical protein [unclassified Rhizobium]|uniref:hypothetical protein n=1 Tax=unclassified Rhizobium TaxID=2613769 RepID=UPI0038114EF7
MVIVGLVGRTLYVQYLVRAVPWSKVYRFATDRGYVYLKWSAPAYASEAALMTRMAEQFPAVMASHEILGGKVNVYRRGGLTRHCSASVQGRQYRASTKETGLEQAKAFAEDWYLGLRGKLAAGILKQRPPLPKPPRSSSRNMVSLPKASAVRNGWRATAFVCVST